VAIKMFDLSGRLTGKLIGMSAIFILQRELQFSNEKGAFWHIMGHLAYELKLNEIKFGMLKEATLDSF